jgi:hypothetical protein
MVFSLLFRRFRRINKSNFSFEFQMRALFIYYICTMKTTTNNNVKNDNMLVVGDAVDALTTSAH